MIYYTQRLEIFTKKHNFSGAGACPHPKDDPSLHPNPTPSLSQSHGSDGII